jgi:hypothetical protein
MNETKSDGKDFGFWLAALLSVAVVIFILAALGIGVWWLFIQVSQSAGGC